MLARGNGTRLADGGHLPEDECGTAIDGTRTSKEGRRVEACTAVCRRVDAEIREQAVLSRHRREHPRLVSLGARACDRLVRGTDKDAGVSVERCAYSAASPHGLEDRLDDRLVHLLARRANAVMRCEVSRLRVERREPLVAERLRVHVEELVGGLDRRTALRGELRPDSNACADDGQRAVAHSLKPRRRAL